MNFKLIVAFVQDEFTETVIERARDLGSTGATVITSAHGEGLHPSKTFFGLTLEGQVDVILFIVEQHVSRKILEGISEVARFEDKSGTGMAVELNIEDAVGLTEQLNVIKDEIKDQL